MALRVRAKVLKQAWSYDLLARRYHGITATSENKNIF